MKSALWMLALFATFNLVWELLQQPLYTLWREGTAGEIIGAVLHCTVGDVLIGLAALTISRWIWGHSPRKTWRFVAIFIALGLGYTMFSEWMNVKVTRNWAYSTYMPLVPPFGTGLTPLLQWIIVPLLTWVTVGAHGRDRMAGRKADFEEHRS